MSDETKIKVLLITGIVTREHRPRRVNDMLCTLLESTGRFEVKITEEFRGATDETLKPYDLLLINYDGKNWPNEPEAIRFGESAEQALFKFVRSGKGAVIYHSAVWGDPKWPDDYWKLMGGRCSYEACSRRCPKGDFIVDKAPGNHPIVQGTRDHWMTVHEDFFAGIEWHPESQVEILETVYDDIENYRVPYFPPPHHAVKIPDGKLENMNGVNGDGPVAWVNHFGEGRSFVLTLGHDMDTIRREGFIELFVRGCEWAATGEVTIGPPEMLGESRLNDWPYYNK